MNVKKAILLMAPMVCLPVFVYAANPKILPGAVNKITRDQYPKTFAQWGAKGVAEINRLAPLAAEKAAASSECNAVEVVDLSSQRSTPPKDIVFFVDCANFKRFYISSKDLADPTPTMSQDMKMSRVKDSDLIKMCMNAIKGKLENPATFDPSVLSANVYRAPATGNVRVTFPFSAKNNFGAELPFNARCIINDQGLKEALISK